MADRTPLAMMPVQPQQADRALQALNVCSEGPIFLQANLHTHGIGGSHPHSVQIWRNADWTGFFGLSRSGMLFVQMGKALAADWTGLTQALAGATITGAIGAASQMDRLMMALAIPAPALSDKAPLDRTEPAFDLDLDALIRPDMTGFSLRSPAPADLDWLTRWRIAYRAEIMGDCSDDVAKTAKAEIEVWLQADSHRLLVQSGHPVSLAGLNARLPGRIQIGGVYTPPHLRGRGLARRAVAALLEERRMAGDRHAYLFAASEDAASAYRAIGFRPAGKVRTVNWPGLAVVPPIGHTLTKNPR